MLPAISWLLLAEALLGLLRGPTRAGCALRVVNAGLLLWLLPGRVTPTLGIGVVTGLLLATAGPLVGRLLAVDETQDTLGVTFPLLLFSALVLHPPGCIVVLLVGLWPLWLTVAMLRNENQGRWLFGLLTCFIIVALMPLLITAGWLVQLARWECSRPPGKQWRRWPARHEQVQPRLRVLPWLALVLPLFLPSLLAFIVVVSLCCLKARGCAHAARLGRVSLALGWLLHGFPSEASPQGHGLALLLACACLFLMPSALRGHRDRAEQMVERGVRVGADDVRDHFEKRRLLLELSAWSLAVGLVGADFSRIPAIVLLMVLVCWFSDREDGLV